MRSAGQAWEGKERMRTAARNPLPSKGTGLPAAGEPHRASSPRTLRRIAPQAPLVRVRPPPRGGNAPLRVPPKAGGLALPPTPSRKWGGERGLRALPPPGPRCAPPPLPRPLPQRRPARQTSPPPPSPRPAPPLTSAGARAGGGGVPAAHRAAGPGSSARELAAAGPGGGDGGGGRRAPNRRPAGGARGRVGARDLPLPPQRGAGQGAGWGGNRPAPLSLAAVGVPAGPPRHLGNRGDAQSPASFGLSGRALVVVKRGREFKVGLGARARLGAWPARAGGEAAGPGMPTYSPPRPLCLFFPSLLQDVGRRGSGRHTYFAYSGRPINVTE